MKKKLLVGIVLAAILLSSGCSGTSNGFFADLEDVGRWGREVTQKSVDNMELRKIRSAIATQNRLMSRGDQMADAVR